MTITKFLIMEIHIKMTEDALCTKNVQVLIILKILRFFIKNNDVFRSASYTSNSAVSLLL